MEILKIIIGILFLGLCIETARTDMQYGKIYNKTLVVCGVAGMILNIAYYGLFVRNLVIIYFLNLVMTMIISLFLFYTHSFAGGDCKLAIVYAILYPARFYLAFGSNKITLFFAIGLAIFFGYVYLLFFSIRSIIKRKTRVSLQYIRDYLVAFVKSFITALIYISAVNLFFILISEFGVYLNTWIVRIVCLLVAWCVGHFKKMRKIPIMVAVLIFDIAIGIGLKTVPFSINPENYLLAFMLLLCQISIRSSLYEEIDINTLSEGMILSVGASMLLQNSRVRGLPDISTEDLRSRLTIDEVESVKRWGKNREINSITVLIKIPFAIFLGLGYLIYFIIWSSVA